jgi:hypothetical protein
VIITNFLSTLESDNNSKNPKTLSLRKLLDEAREKRVDQNSENNMKNMKKEIKWNKDTKKMKRRDQVVIFRFRTGYTMVTHGYIITSKSALSVMSG